MDISGNPEEKEILKLLVASSEEFLQSAGSEPNYQKITDTVALISGAKYAAFNLYDEDESKYTTLAISGPEGIIKKTSAFFGDKLVGKSYKHQWRSAGKLMPHTISRRLILSDVARDIIPNFVSLFSKADNRRENHG